jgi:hypothetical protein
MSKEPSVDVTLSQAEEREKEYNWSGAAESYQQALDLVSQRDFSRMGEIFEKLGYAFYRAAMQAENREEFRERMRLAIEACERGRNSYEKFVGEQKTARMLRCEADAKYLRYWLTSVPSEKRKLLDDSLELKSKASAGFLESEDMLEYGTTYSQFPWIFWCRFHLEWDRQTRKSIVEKGREWGEKAVASLSELGDLRETAKAYLTMFACWVMLASNFIAEPEEMNKERLKGIKELRKITDLSEKVGDAYLLGNLHLWLGIIMGGEEKVGHIEKALECGKQTRDNLLIALSLDFLAYSTYWKAIAIEDPEKRRETAEKAMQSYDEAQRHFAILSFMSPRAGLIGPPAGHAEDYFQAAIWETDSKKRLEYLEKSEKLGMEALKLAQDSDMPEVIDIVFHVLSKTLQTWASAEPESAEKRILLERALQYREKTIEFVEKLTSFDYWNLGVMDNYLAEIKAELADIETDPDNKRRLLEGAVTIKEKCLDLCSKMIPFSESEGDLTLFGAIQGYQDNYATLLMNLYDLTNKQEHLRKAIEVSQKAIESASKLDMISRIAESNWKIAKAHDVMGEHLKAAGKFERASENYVKAAEKIPQLKDFYRDYASYTQAWSEIERARHHHARQEYGSAKEHFEKAANLLKPLEQWSYLTSNYAAWTEVENAEDLSRKEQSEEAFHAFEQAAELFRETKKTLQTRLSKIEGSEEKQMATNLLKATDMRHDYCMARITLEEAKILDKKGDHYSSSEKYGAAAEAFERISQALESEQDQREFRFIISLSRAWQKLTQAEAETLPALYTEASQLFEEAKELSPNEKAKTLTLGHSRFCRALEAGTRFADTRDPTLHATAIQHLESAANYYVKAGFQNASEYAKATKLLFDAYMHMDDAEKETNHEKKARLYMIAEKVLQTSAGAYMKAEHPEKREQVLRLLEKVREEKQLAISVAEILHAPSIVSTTTTFSTPTPTIENAAGLDRFEHADIQANVTTRQMELKVGENLDLEIELVNAGRGTAVLIKLAEIIPDGFDVAEKPETYRVEDSYLNMKGKQLYPLKTEEIRLVLKPKTQGKFLLKPKILYLDENGKYKSHEPEPITITVKELGIKGWLKGER